MLTEDQKKHLKIIKNALYRLIDAVLLEREYDTLKCRCENYDFVEIITRLARIEQDQLMSFISFKITELLPEKKGILNTIFRECYFKRGEHWVDVYPYVLKIRGFETECQAYCCLHRIFTEVDNSFNSYRVCGYSDIGHYFYIDL